MSSQPAASVRGLTCLYELALHLYPDGFRHEYGDEMQGVFRLKAGDAAQQGGFGLAKFAWREAFHLPGAIVCSHLRERSAKMKRISPESIQGGPLNLWKIAAVFLPFVFGMLLSLRNDINTLFVVLAIALAVLLVATWIAGLVTRFSGLRPSRAGVAVFHPVFLASQEFYTKCHFRNRDFAAIWAMARLPSFPLPDAFADCLWNGAGRGSGDARPAAVSKIQAEGGQRLDPALLLSVWPGDPAPVHGRSVYPFGGLSIHRRIDPGDRRRPCT